MEIRPGIHWVGVRDPDLEVFDVIIPTEYGTTYNSYLVEAEEPALIDGVKEEFQEEWFAKLEARIDLAKLKHLIVNHTEPDHSGSIKELLRRAPIWWCTVPARHCSSSRSRSTWSSKGAWWARMISWIWAAASCASSWPLPPLARHHLDLSGRGGCAVYLRRLRLALCFPEGKILASQQEVDFTPRWNTTSTRSWAL